MKAIEVNQVSHSFDGKKVLTNINFTVKQGEVLCLMGASGVGKTTLMKILMQRLLPEHGNVTVPERASVVFQESRVLAKVSAVTNVRIALSGRGRYVTDMQHTKNPEQSIRQELSCLLPEEVLDQPAGTLSGGMSRRMEIVRAMMADSDVIYMDEPFSGLDEQNKQIAVNYILERKGSRPLLVITHDVKDAAALGAPIYLLTKEA